MSEGNIFDDDGGAPFLEDCVNEHWGDTRPASLVDATREAGGGVPR